MAEERRLQAEVAVVGGSLGGVAAALAVLEAGRTVILSEAGDWLGGQMTSQGVSALDEHPLIETFGATRSYLELRRRIREGYARRYGVSAMPDGAPLNPGNGWVSRLCFEPRAGLEVIEAWLEPYRRDGRLTLLLRHRPHAAEVRRDAIRRLTLAGPGGRRVHLEAGMFLDATDLGEVLPLAGAEHVVGAEARADTGEPHALDQADPSRVQSFTVCFAVEFRPGEDHTVPRPAGYRAFRERQPYGLELDGGARRFRMFAPGPAGELPFWTYRRLVDAGLLGCRPPKPGKGAGSGPAGDVALINWAANDYRFGSLLGSPAEARRALREARRLSLGFLHWLQTEAPRDDRSGRGYPELKLRPDVMGTAAGLARAPYVREARRIRGLARIVEQDIVAAVAGAPGARARPRPDSVGIGWYPLDLHPCVGAPEASSYRPTRPFQLPLGALVPVRLRNLLPACKNLATTHLSNGACRVHPVEWAVGEAAGVLACCCLDEALAPQTLAGRPRRLRRLQRRLLARGAPLFWASDLGLEDPLFAPAQLLAVAGGLATAGPRAERLELRPEEPVVQEELATLLGAALGRLPAWRHPASDARSVAGRAVVEAAFAACGLPRPDLGERPRLAELCRALAPLLGA